MAKLIAVNEEVYSKLRKLKGKRSFSATIDKLLESKSGNIKKYFGALRDRTDLDKIEDEITANRRIAGVKRRGAMAGV